MAEVLHKYIVEELALPVAGCYTHNVQTWTSTDGGQSWGYCGKGQYCKSAAEAEAYRRRMEATDPKHVRPQDDPQQQAPKLHGDYYYFDCLDADIGDKLTPVGDYDGDRAAIQTAADYEATLYRYEYRRGELVISQVLYDPFL